MTIVLVKVLFLPCLPIKHFNFSRLFLIFLGKSIVSIFSLINSRRVIITILIISVKPSSESRSSFFRSSKFDSKIALKIIKNLLSSYSLMSISRCFFLIMLPTVSCSTFTFFKNSKTSVSFSLNECALFCASINFFVVCFLLKCYRMRF